jgi:hypothetical protein
MNITRRTLARMLAATAAANGAEAQTPSAASPSSGIDEDMIAVQEQLQSNERDIAKVMLPMATEPAFRFKA